MARNGLQARLCLLVWAVVAALAPQPTELPAPAAAGVPTVTLFVDALRGDDSAAGTTLVTAFATLRRAQQAVRALPRPDVSTEGNGTPLAVVSLRSAGIHWLHRSARNSAPWAVGPLALGGDPDSGVPGRAVIWRTHPTDAGNATISAGYPLPGTGWRPAPVRAHQQSTVACHLRSTFDRPLAIQSDAGLWQQHVPAIAAGRFCPQQLWANGSRLSRARLPQQGFYQWHAALDPINHTNPLNSYGLVFGDDFAPTVSTHAIRRCY